MLADVTLQAVQVGCGALHGVEPGAQDLAGCIVDEGDQAALAGASLKPGVRAAVDLHQLAPGAPALARTVDSARALPLGLPQAFLDHPAAQGLGSVGKAVALGQVLGSKGGAEVTIVLAHQAQ
jgi:hypothetical protein